MTFREDAHPCTPSLDPRLEWHCFSYRSDRTDMWSKLSLGENWLYELHSCQFGSESHPCKALNTRKVWLSKPYIICYPIARLVSMEDGTELLNKIYNAALSGFLDIPYLSYLSYYVAYNVCHYPGGETFKQN